MTSSSNCQIEQPFWNRILEDCKKKNVEKHKHYGNSWKEEMFYEHKFWSKRLEEEYNEVQELLKIYGVDQQKLMKECIDLINICAMIYSIEAHKDWSWKVEGRHG